MKLHSKYKNMLGFSMQRQQPFNLPSITLQIFGASQRTHVSLLYSIQSTQNPTNSSQLTKHMICMLHSTDKRTPLIAILMHRHIIYKYNNTYFSLCSLLYIFAILGIWLVRTVSNTNTTTRLLGVRKRPNMARCPVGARL